MQIQGLLAIGRTLINQFKTIGNIPTIELVLYLVRSYSDDRSFWCFTQLLGRIVKLQIHEGPMDMLTHSDMSK
ncbi:hypothetical protein ABKN59_010155 [Abortiporus biennis]